MSQRSKARDSQQPRSKLKVSPIGNHDGLLLESVAIAHLVLGVTSRRHKWIAIATAVRSEDERVAWSWKGKTPQPIGKDGTAFNLSPRQKASQNFLQ